MNNKIIEAEDIKRLLYDGEHLTLEMKKCKNSVPDSVWETVSAFANTRGGIILLGIIEHKERPLPERFEIAGVRDANKVVTDFFNMLNNPQKINRSVLVDSDVRIVPVDGVNVIYIKVPEADYRQKPIYINQKLEHGTYKRGHEGDRRVNKEELALLLRDSSDDVDSQIIEHYGMDDIDVETLRKYRQSFTNNNPGHAYEDLSDRDFLIQMGGYDIDRQKGIEGITMAGLLMFGQSVHIHKNFPNFRVDYLDLINIEPGDSKKWNDRLTDDGRWVDNLYNFLILTLRKLLFTLPSEGKLEGVQRRDGGVLYEAVREAMINSLTYCDYLLGGVLRIDRRTDRIVMRNPGTLRIPPERIYNGDYTQARNSTIQKLLRMVGFGDNIGSGFQKIMKSWQTLGYGEPDIHEETDVNEVWLTLPLKLTLTARDTVNDGVNVNGRVNERVKDGVNVNDHVNERVNDGVKDGVNVNDNVNDSVNADKNLSTQDYLSAHLSTHLSAQQMQILNIVSNNPTLTIPEIAEALGVKETYIRSQRRVMEKFVELKRMGSRKAGSWEIVVKDI